MTFTIDTKSHRSPNYNERPNGAKSISAILLHSDEGTAESSIPWLCNPHTGDARLNTKNDPRVSSHYYITREGDIFQLVDDVHRAWHAGSGEYAGIDEWNDASIGIEVEHKQGGSGWTPKQKDALAWLCRFLMDKYHITTETIAAHRWIAPRRKQDPTDWNDTSLHAFINALDDNDTSTAKASEKPADVSYVTYQVIDPCDAHNTVNNFAAVREDADVNAPIALGGSARLQPGETFIGESDTYGTRTKFVHISAKDKRGEIGFVAKALVKKVKDTSDD